MLGQTSNGCGWFRVFLLLVVFCCGCASGPSHFRRSIVIEQEFESYHLFPGHTYYYNGWDYSPDAVVAIKNEYVLKSPYWHKIEMDKEKLRLMVDEMMHTPFVAPNNPTEHGAYITDDEGNIIGAWYSMYITPILKFKSATEIYISMPIMQITEGNRLPF